MKNLNGATMPHATAQSPKADAAEKPGAGLRILSFFTGCGGLDLGFEQAGFETVYATDIDADSCETLQLNVGRYFNPSIKIERADIIELKPATLPKDIDLIIGGPPCQSFFCIRTPGWWCRRTARPTGPAFRGLLQDHQACPAQSLCF